MRNGEYGLGIDVGDGAVSAAVCAVDGQAGSLPLGEGRVTAAVGDDGAVVLVPADGKARPLLTRVGDPIPVYTGGRAVPAAELVAATVVRVRELAAERAGRPDAWTVVTVPPSWAGHRWAVLAGALTEAGVPRFSLVSGAVAAVAAHVAAGDLPAEPTVAVYDLGAGTLDTAVVGPTADQPLVHLAGPPAPLTWGGRDVDDAVAAHVAGCLDTPAADPAALRVACVAAKEALSTATVVQVGTADGPVRLTREELDEVLAEPTQRSAAVLAATVAAAGLRPADLDAVVLAGGGVRVPLVAEVLSGELGRPLVVGADPALTAALGAATLAAGALAAEEPAVAGPAVVEPAVVAPVVAVPVATASASASAVDDHPAPALPHPRGPRSARAAQDRTRPGPAGPAGRRGARLGRGAVVTGLALGLLTLGPAAAGLYDAVLAPPPAGHESAADEGDVVARGSAAVGDTAPARADGAAGPAAVPAGGSPARTSLAAAIATAARTGPAPAPGRVAPAQGSTAARSSGAAADASRAAGTTTGTPGTGIPSTAGTGTPTAVAPAPTRPAAGDAPPAGPPVVAKPPTAQEPPTSQEPPGTPGPGGPSAGETPAEQPEPTPTEPTPTEPTPTEPGTVDPAPVEPAPAPPAAEEPAAEEPTAPAPVPAAGPAAGTAAATTAGAP